MYPLASRRQLGGLAQSGGGAVEQRVIYDSFTGANGTTITSRSPDICPPGSSWNNANFTILDNHATLETEDRQLTVIERGVSDCIINVDINWSWSIVNAGTTPVYYSGIVFRYTDASNYWLAGFNDRSDVTGFRIFKIEGGASTAVTNGVAGAINGTVYPLSVTLNGNDISVLFNNTAQLTTSSAFNNTATKHGIRLGYRNLSPAPGTVTHADNFEVRNLT